MTCVISMRGAAFLPKGVSVPRCRDAGGYAKGGIVAGTACADIQAELEVCRDVLPRTSCGVQRGSCRCSPLQAAQQNETAEGAAVRQQRAHRDIR